MLLKHKNDRYIHLIDKGIVKYIQEINEMGFKTIMSCSGMKREHLYPGCPYICFEPPRSSKQKRDNFLKFVGDCLFNSNWFVEFFYPYVVGYLPKGMRSKDIKARFQKFIENLKLREGFTHSYMISFHEVGQEGT